MTALRKNDIQVLSSIEHVLKRPHIYCGSPKEEEIETHLYTENGIEFKTVKIIPALNKIISEILDNSRDEATVTNYKYATRIDVTYDNGLITVRDNGRGLPIEYSEQQKKWVPELIFTQLRAGSNFTDDERKSAGQNGMGASLTAILSKKFSVDTCNGHQRYQQTYENSLARINKPKISDVESKSHYTEVSFEPNYDFFNISDEAKAQLPDIIKKMCVETAFCFPEINFYFQHKKVSVKSLKQFLSSIHETYEMGENENCRIGVFFSDTDFKHISFVNGLATTRGGTHVNYVSDTIVAYIREYAKKKYKLDIKPIDIKSKLFLFLSLRITNCQFDSQTKEYCTNQVSEFKDIINQVLDEKFLKSIIKNEEIMFPIIEAYRLKQQVKENQELKKITSVKKIKIDKYYPASEQKQYLTLCEGDSASGGLMPVLGRKNFSYFALKGKPLNTLDIPKSKIMDNEELKNIIQILNLRLDVDDQSLCNYENIVFATDSDLDGRSIQSLLLCFFYRFAKSLLLQKRIMFLQTPIIVAKQKGKVKHSFMTLSDYSKFKESTTDKFEYIYVKGLGSNSKEDLKSLYDKNGLYKYLQPFVLDEETEQMINSWMSKSSVEKRKEFLRDKEFDIGNL